MTQDNKDKAINLYEEGVSFRKISRDIGVPYGSVRLFLMGSGVNIRDKKKVSESDEKAILDIYSSGFTTDKTASIVGFSQKTVSNILLKNNIPTRRYEPRKVKENEHDEIVRQYEEGSSLSKIARSKNVSHGVISKIAKKCGINKRSNSEARREYAIEDNVFSSMTEDSEYWLGFIGADGNLFNDVLTIGLQEADLTHIHKFQLFCGSNHPVKTDKNGCKIISISNKPISQDLKKNGITPNKSKTFTPTDYLSRSTSFWRGMIDGDGCIHIAKGTNRPILSLTSGSMGCMNAFEAWVKDRCDTLATVRTKECGNFVFSLVGANAIKIMNELYGKPHKYSLDRKYEKAKPFLDGEV